MGIEWESTMHEVIRIGVLNQIVLLALAWPFINDEASQWIILKRQLAKSWAMLLQTVLHLI